MSHGSRILKCASDDMVNETAVAEALTSVHIAGAALDVFGEEPPPADHPLLQFPNVVTTPHLGASTTEAQESVAREAAQLDRKSTRLNSSHANISYAVFCLKQKKMYLYHIVA